MINKFALILLCILAVNVKLADPVLEDDVLVLTDENFDETIAKYEFILVEFYAPWCGHCKKLTPEYAGAAGVLKGENVVLAKLDATAHTKSASKFSIQGYPTLKFFVKGVDSEYNGGRTKNEIVAWLRKKTGPASKELNGVEAVEAFKNGADVVVVHFGSEGLSTFLDLAKTFDDVVFGHCVAEDCLSNFEAENGSVAIFKNFDEKRNNLAKGYDAASFKTFVETKTSPTVMAFDEKCAQSIFGKNIPGLFLYYDKNAENSAALEAIFSEVAVQVKSKIQAVKTGITQGLETRLAEYIGVTAADLPTVRIADTRADMKKFNMSGDITAENILNFVNEWSNGALKQSLKSEEIPKEQNEPVYVLVGKNFDDVVMDPTKDVLVKFYAPWCGHCKKIAPIYDEVATNLKHNTNLIIAKMDSTLNETDKVSIQGFPTIKFFPAGNKTPIDFEGDRTVEGFTAFLNKHATNQIKNNKDDL